MMIFQLLSVSLGSVETSLLNLTSAYATFVNGGKKIKPVLINRIQDRRGKQFFYLNLQIKRMDRYTENKNEAGFPKLI